MIIKIIFKKIKTYSLLLLSIIGLISALILEKINLSEYVVWLAIIEAILVLIPTLYQFYDHFRYGNYDLNIIGIVAIIFSIIYRYYTVSLIMLLFLTLYPVIEKILLKYLKNKTITSFNAKNLVSHLNTGKKIIDQLVIKLKKNDKITIMAGETIPADCTIIEGKSNFDESIIFENQKITKSVGDILYQGSVNLDNTIIAKINNSYSESYLSLKNKTIKQALISQSTTSKLIINNVFVYYLIVLTIAILDFMLTNNHNNFLKIIVLSSPFILLLPATTAYLSTIKILAKNNVIIKSGKNLERLVKAKSVVFTKNNVLNSDYDVIEKIVSFSDLTNDELLIIAASMQTNINHKIAEALINQIKHKKLKLLKIKNIQQIDKHHLKANYKNQIIQIGSPKIIEQNSIIIPKKFNPKTINSTAILIVIDNHLVGTIIFENKIADTTPKAIKYLKDNFKNLIIMSGDHKYATKLVANELNISEFYYNYSLKDKLNYLENEKRRPFIFISTNAHNNPLYQRSNVSIELNKNIPNLLDNPANIILPNNDLTTVLYIHKIASKDYKNIKQLIIASLFINLLLIVLALHYNYSLTLSTLISPINIILIVIFILFKDYKLQKISQ